VPDGALQINGTEHRHRVNSLSNLSSNGLPVGRCAEPAQCAMQVERDDSSLFLSVEASADTLELAVSDDAKSPGGSVFSFNPQDQRVFKTGTTVIPNVTQGNGPQTDRIKLMDTLEPQDGKYVYPDGDARQAKAQTFAAAARAFNLFSQAYGEVPFAFEGKQLSIFADAGKMLQGFYRREQKALTFYHSPDKVYGGTVYSGASNDVASHETAHAMLDGIRPNYYQSLTPEPRAFHEAFGDIMAIHSSLADDRVVAKVAIQTGGDLKKPNVAALIAEEMGAAVNNEDGANTTGGDYLRDANNPFTYQDPFTLQEKGPLSELRSNRHNFSRVWTGAHYDLLALMVKDEMAKGTDVKAAISSCNAELLQMLANMMKEAPLADFTFPQMADAMLKGEATRHGGKRLELMRQAFAGRNILPADHPLPEVPVVKTLRTELSPASLPSVLENNGLLNELPPQQQPSSVVNRLVSLDESFGHLSGANLEMPFDLSLKAEEIKASQERNLASLRNLIKNDRILVDADKADLSTPESLRNPKGESYAAGLFKQDGALVVKALAVNVCDFHDHSTLADHDHHHNHEHSHGIIAT
jgi:hypothetical protein